MKKENTKENFIKTVKKAEEGITRSILKWKYKKNGVPVPKEQILENESQKITDIANKAVYRGTKTFFTELKKTFSKPDDGERKQ